MGLKYLLNKHKVASLPISYTYITVPPIGKILLVSRSNRLIGLYMENQQHLYNLPKEWEYTDNLLIFLKTKNQLEEYFSLQRTKFTIDYELEGTIFQKKIWNHLTQIPYSSLSTYRALATLASYPTAVRATASALAQNPLSILVPCHRIIRSNGSLGDYAGGLPIKKHLLDLEQKAEIEKNKIP